MIITSMDVMPEEVFERKTARRADPAIGTALKSCRRSRGNGAGREGRHKGLYARIEDFRNVNSQEPRRIRLLFAGIVHGVGFRPAIYRIAVECKLGGFVCMAPEGAVVEVEGQPGRFEDFLSAVLNRLPPAAEVAAISQEDIPARGDRTFAILSSREMDVTAVPVSPDLAVCSNCLRELEDPQDRRHRYPFINCSECGPRLTIIRDVPYERENTSMACFPLCPQCRSEYENPTDRRFHAEPNACPLCGPRLWMADERGEPLAGDPAHPVEEARELLRRGKILAIKGIGGFHLAVDAANEEAVKRLRIRMSREEQPLAVMVENLSAAERIAEIGLKERELLTSPQRPIVLCRRKRQIRIAPSVAPGVLDLGIILPYTPLHALLLEENFFPLVMAGAHRVGEPICRGNRVALSHLQGIADGFLLHNRDILVRCDDSVVTVAQGKAIMIRRSRGYAPRPIPLQHSYPAVLALGSRHNATLCILKGNQAYLSPHIGDLDTPGGRTSHLESRKLMEKISSCQPKVLACDLHPACCTARLAEELPHREIFRVQHHHAHIVSAMAENGLSEQVIGLAMDGTAGYGPDGTLWGGEFLLSDEEDFQRAGNLEPFPLPDPDRAVREPWLAAVGLLRESYGHDWQDIARSLTLKEYAFQFEQLNSMMASGLNSPRTSSLGRVFDAVAALLGIRHEASFAGQTAMELEALADVPDEAGYPFLLRYENGRTILDLSALVQELVQKRIYGIAPQKIASRFQTSMIKALAAMACEIRERSGIEKAVLSGGCFQNRTLFNGVSRELKKDGFAVYTHINLPPNDGCIALGQAVVAATRLKRRGS